MLNFLAWSSKQAEYLLLCPAGWDRRSKSRLRHAKSRTLNIRPFPFLLIRLVKKPNPFGPSQNKGVVRLSEWERRWRRRRRAQKEMHFSRRDTAIYNSCQDAQTAIYKPSLSLALCGLLHYALLLAQVLRTAKWRSLIQPPPAHPFALSV
jgi:hypothetical protein